MYMSLALDCLWLFNRKHLLTCSNIYILNICSLCYDTFTSQNISKVTSSTDVEVIVAGNIASQ